MLPNAPRPDFPNMPIRIFEINTFPTKFPIGAARDGDAEVLKVRIPLYHIGRATNGEAEMLFEMGSVAWTLGEERRNDRVARTVARDKPTLSSVDVRRG